MLFNCREKICSWRDIYTDVSGDEEESDQLSDQLSDHFTFEEYESELDESTSCKIHSLHQGFSGGGRNVKNQNIEGSEHQKFF